jgi:hypothetical protein
MSTVSRALLTLKFSFVFDIQTEERNYLFCASTSQERDAWITKLVAFTTEARKVTLQRGTSCTMVNYFALLVPVLLLLQIKGDTFQVC